MEPDIRKILEAAIMAPSGENAQPWHFVVKNKNIKVYNVPERDQSLYSWGQRASFLAIGAAIENISISASNLGYTIDIKEFPDKSNLNFVADISLNNQQTKADPLYAFIAERCTNRKPYATHSLSLQEESELFSSIKDAEVKMHFTQENHHKQKLGAAGSANEVVMLSNKHLHEFFFSHVNWTKEEDDLKKIGFFIHTLELPPPAKVGFKILKNWKIAKIMQKVGMHKSVGKQNAKVNSSAAGFGAISIPNKDPQSFLNAGRSMQRIWLTATKLGLSMQPLTGIIFFMYKVLANETEKFSEKHISIIKEAYGEIENVFSISSNETIAFMFRIGHGGKPTARSSRFPVDKVSEVIN